MKLTVFLLALLFIQCQSPSTQKIPQDETNSEVEESEEVMPIQTGAEQLEFYLPMLKGKTVALMVNQTSTVRETHLVDTLLSHGVKIKHIFAPEHGFRGKADRGASIQDDKDAKTGLPIISLYGKKKKPGTAELEGVDLVIFDIQDVGARFYTYISSMHYLMEGCVEQDVPLIVFDRPNPNGHYVDGPIMEKEYQSFVGMHPVPVVHGMTVGEYAQMINGEGWLKDKAKCELTIIPCKNYNHETPYELPIKPSPNLPNARSIYLYPSLCFFEGTVVSVGRGTDKQFQVLGHPSSTIGDFTFTPTSKEGASAPLHKDVECRGIDLSKIDAEKFRSTKNLDLSYLLEFYKDYKGEKPFFNANLFFDKLAGTAKLRQQIEDEVGPEQIWESWQEGLNAFKLMRQQYLLYP